MDADDLYRLPPEDFTAARDAAARAAKADGDAAAAAKDLERLRRPSVAAWLVNVLAAEDGDLLEQLLALGPALADAQAAGSGDVLRELGAQRRSLVGAVTDRAVALADRPVTLAVRDEVSATLETALSDPASADAVRSGRLVRALSYAGFGGADLSGAVAAPPAGSPGPKPQPKGKAQRDAAQIAVAEAAALAAAGALDDAVRACERDARVAEQAEETAVAARTAVDQARTGLQAAERSAQDADEQAHAAQEEGERAVERVREAQDAEERARLDLDQLRRRTS